MAGRRGIGWSPHLAICGPRQAPSASQRRAAASLTVGRGVWAGERVARRPQTLAPLPMARSDDQGAGRGQPWLAWSIMTAHPAKACRRGGLQACSLVPYNPPTMLAAVAPSTRVLAGQRLAACSNGQRTTMKSKSTYQARSWGCGRPGAAVLGLAACRPTTAGRALAPPRRPRHPASTSERHNVGGQPAQRACRGGPALVHRRRRSPAVPVLPGLRASPSAVCVLILLASALRFPALQVMVVVGDDEPQDNALKRFRREVMSAGKQREQSAMHHPAAWQ